MLSSNQGLSFLPLARDWCQKRFHLLFIL
jgi:hypothetical protein